MALIIKSNVLSTSDVLIRDLGIIIPMGGGFEVFPDSDLFNIQAIRKSTDIRTLITDNAFATEGSTLILNDGVNDIDQDDAISFLDRILNSQIPTGVIDQLSTGRVQYNGCIKLGGRNIRVNSGYGYVKEGPPDQASPAVLIHVVWPQTDLIVPANSKHSMIVDKNGIVQLSTVFVDAEDSIFLGVVLTDATDITFLSHVDIDLVHKVSDGFRYLRDINGPLNVSGNSVTEYSPPSLQLTIDSGTYYIAGDRKTSLTASPATFRYWYRDGLGGFTSIASQMLLDPDFYDDGSGTLAALSAGQFKKDLVFIAPNSNSSTEVHIIYGQEVFASQMAAESGNIPTPPPEFTNWALRLAGAILLQGASSITSIVDIRPVLGQFAPPSTSVTDHGFLSGLSDDDHTQYQLRTEKGTTNGYGSLDSSSQQPISELKTMIGATAGLSGTRGSVPTPIAGQQGHILLGNATWVNPQSIFAGSETFIATATDTITTTSLTFIAVSSMTITPGAGTYIVLFSASAFMNKNSETVQASIFANGAQIVSSARRIGGQANNAGNFNCQAMVTISAGQAIDARWLISSNAGGGQGTMYERSLILIKTLA